MRKHYALYMCITISNIATTAVIIIISIYCIRHTKKCLRLTHLNENGMQSKQHKRTQILKHITKLSIITTQKPMNKYSHP